MAVHEFRGAVDSRRDIIDAYGASRAPGVTTHDVLGVLEYAVQTAGAGHFRARPERAREARHGHDDLGLPAHRRARLHRPRRRQPRLHGARRSNGAAHRGSLARSTSSFATARSRARRWPSRPTPRTRTRSRAPSACTKRSQVDTIDLEVLPGDQFLLCSDGLHAYLDEKEISRQLAEESITAIPGKLVDHANAGGGHDNITAVVLRVHTDATATSDARSQELEPQGRGAQADAAVPAPDVQGDPARFGPHRGARTTRRATRSSPRTSRAASCSSFCRARCACTKKAP